MENVHGVRDLIVEQQTLIPQIKIEYDRERLLAVGLTVDHLNKLIETAMNGQVVSEVMQGQRTFDLVVRLKDDARENYDVMRRLPVDLPLGGSVPLESIVKISQSLGPNSIQREKIRRRIVILGGVISSTLLDFFVHPALFWLFGRRSAQRAVEIRAESFEGELPISTT